MTNQQPDFTALPPAWQIDGDTAQRGNVILRHYKTQPCYHAQIYIAGIGFITVTQFTAADALNSFRAKLADELAKHEAITSQLYDALAAIDAPEPLRPAGPAARSRPVRARYAA